MNLGQIFVAWIVILSGMELQPPTSLPCKYSVRDVAFVNIHQQPWQLQLLKPTSKASGQLELWDTSIARSLERTNIDYTWVDTDSPQGKLICQRVKDANQNVDTGIVAVMSHPSNETNVLKIWDPLKIEVEINELVESPTRQLVLNNVSECLCQFLLIKSGNPKSDLLAQQAVQQARDAINKQMWSYEKAPDLGPMLCELKPEDREREAWLLQSIGLSADDLKQPVVVVLYGQGISLGEPLTGTDQLKEKLIARASICGRNCECDLDKQWLYGKQFLHRWTLANEQAAESSLDFDPHSTLVQAEVQQIIQKAQTAGNSVGTEPPVQLGGGLIIHDLDALNSSAANKKDKQTNHAEQMDSKDKANRLEENLDNDQKPITASQPAIDSQNPNRTSDVPWFLLGGLALMVLIFFTIFWQRLNPGSGATKS